MNRLCFGDNLKWLSDRKEFPDASVDLVYLDPAFNLNADYNVLFREPSKQRHFSENRKWSYTRSSKCFKNLRKTISRLKFTAGRR